MISHILHQEGSDTYDAQISLLSSESQQQQQQPALLHWIAK